MDTERFVLSPQEVDIWEMFLLKVRYKASERITLKANHRLHMNSPEDVFIVYSGRAHLFLGDLNADGSLGAHKYLFSGSTGSLLFGIDTAAYQKSVIADADPDTVFLKMQVADFRKLAKEDELVASVVALMVERWLQRLDRMLAPSVPPKEFVTAGTVPLLPEGVVLHPREHLIWVRHQSGSSTYLNFTENPISAEDGYVPLSARGWLTTRSFSALSFLNTEDLIIADQLFERLQSHHRRITGHLIQRMRDAEIAERQRLHRKREDDERRFALALREVAATLGQAKLPPLRLQESADLLFAAAAKVAAHEDIELKALADYQLKSGQQPLLELARASRFRARRVSLRGEWWKSDSGALLGYLKADDSPVALIPTSASSYEMYNPATNSSVPVNQEVARSLSYFAQSFYRRFDDQAINALRLLRFGLRDVRRDLRSLLLIGALIGLLQIVNPIVTQFIFDDVIPTGDRVLLLQIGGALVSIALAIAMLSLVQAVSIIRIESRAESSIQPALWDRLLELPVSFFRDYSAGDLGTRAMGISIMRSIISGMATMSILSGIFSIFNLFLMFYYSFTLGLVALGLVLLAMAVTAYAGYVNVKIQRGVSDFQGKLAGYTLQFINGISKFRVAEAESRVFSFWAKKYSEQRQAAFRARMVENRLAMFLAAFPAFSLLVLFAVLGRGTVELSVGRFLAFNTAYTQFLGAALQFSGAIVVILAIVPLYERARPILNTLPEITEAKAPPPELTGNIEVAGVSFRYTEKGPLVLEDVSFTVKQGQFVALVGASGSGKSTIMRLLLGFEQPETGGIYYDGYDLSEMDLRGVRRQIGVVLQNSKLMSGSDIFTNIVGASNRSMDEAWKAAESAGFAPDIREMPMGMHTVVAEGGGTLSGGQRQRLLIARAIINKPRILFFDEATSALDNRTQAIVSESLEKLASTRIVIAHRLSTIMNADNIIVMEKGRIVQQGTYDTLVRESGAFADLAARQLT